MSKTILVAIVALVALDVALAASCNNLFATINPSFNSSGGHYLSAPFKSDGKFCAKLLPSGSESCCPNEMLNDIQTVFKKGQQEFDEQSKQVKSQLDQTKSQLANMPIPDDIKGPINDMLDLVPKIFDAAGRCMNGIFGFSSGIVCLTCSPDTPKYFNPETFELQVAEASCTAIADNCGQVLDIMQEVIEKMHEMLKKMPGGIPDVPEEYRQLLDPKSSVCSLLNQTGAVKQGSDCKRAICDVLSALISMPINKNPLPMPSAFSQPEHAALHMHAHMHHFGMSSLHLAIGTAAEAKKQAKVVYTKDGYDAYSVGCDSGVTPGQCPAPSSSGLSTAAIIGIVAGCAVGLLLVGFAVYKCRQPKEEPLIDHGSTYQPQA